MSLTEFIRGITRNQDGSVTLTADELQKLLDRLDRAESLLADLVAEFKQKADVYCIKTRWNKPYRAAKAYFTERGGK